MFGVVRAPRVYEHIVAQIERAIYEGRLAHGDKLPPERQLVREFAASRVAVREALRALEHRGLVEVRQGSAGGYFIREVDDTQEAVRVVLEEGHEIEIKPAPKLKPLLTYPGYVPEGWKDAIYEPKPGA